MKTGYKRALKGPRRRVFWLTQFLKLVTYFAIETDLVRSAKPAATIGTCGSAIRIATAENSMEIYCGWTFTPL
ncbi:hypothetical protein EBU99_04820 [bacterium]|nr:hypothetical protein [bacterium]